jgi:hypothetical protein
VVTSSVHAIADSTRRASSPASVPAARPNSAAATVLGPEPVRAVASYQKTP